MPIARIVFASVLVLWSGKALAVAVETGSIEGRVRYAGSDDPVAGATVVVEGIVEARTTDEFGVFHFADVAPGLIRLEVTSEGMETLRLAIEVKAGETTTLKCALSPTDSSLSEVVVRAEPENASELHRTMTREELAGVPGANGDVIRVVQNLPGVGVSGIVTEYRPEGLVIRGTSPEDSKYYFNGFEIPQLFHFGALISIVNAEMVDDIVYYPGGFGVSQGDAIGGSVDVRCRSPRNDRRGGAVDLSTYSAYAVVEGPLAPRVTGAAAVRRSTIDYVLPEIVPEEEASFLVSPRFYDYVARLEYQPRPSHRVALTGLGTYDHAELLRKVDENEPFSPDAFDIEIGWQTATLAWDFTPSAHVTQSLSVQYFHLRNEFVFGQDQGVRSTVSYPAVREEISVGVAPWNTLKAGAMGTLASFATSGALPMLPKEGNHETSWTNADSTRFSEDSRTWKFEGWIEDVIEPSPWARLTPGVRVNHMQLIEETTTDPRLLMRFAPTRASAIKASTGLYHQWPDYDELLPNLGSDELRAELAAHAGAGFEYEFDRGYSIDLQGYYKRLYDLISRTAPGAPEPYENTGEGFVYGAELLARKKLTDRLFGWVSYTWSVSRRKDDPAAQWRYFDQDQTHNVVALASYALGERKLWKLGVRWQIATGKPETEIEGAVFNSATDSYLPVYSEDVNGIRERAFHQLDIRVDKLWVFHAWTLGTYLDVQNVYGQRYPIGYRYNFDYSERRPVTFPNYIPSFGLQARF